ncbi:hypothetical protein [Phytohabitans flavus]|nr:hypothetical protein [Phytohabitans flavus]
MVRHRYEVEPAGVRRDRLGQQRLHLAHPGRQPEPEEHLPVRHASDCG